MSKVNAMEVGRVDDALPQQEVPVVPVAVARERLVLAGLQYAAECHSAVRQRLSPEEEEIRRKTLDGVRSAL